MNKKQEIQNSSIYDLYWQFAVKRQEIFFNRINKKSTPWSDDQILQTYKFTNVYRATDRVSQYLINNVIYNGENYSDEDTVFRILLFKIFNKIETWQKIESHFNKIDYGSFDEEKYGAFLDVLQEAGEKIYSAAYIMPSGTTSFGSPRKHKNHLAFIKYMFKDGIVKKISNCKTLEDLYLLLLSYPTIGKFLAFQYAIDLNYSEICNFDEMSFVVAGPGAKHGIKKCFPRICLSDEEIIHYAAEHQDEEFKKRGLDFKRIGNRPLQLIDCQNIFCELDKYTRVSNPEFNIGHSRIKQKYEYIEKKRIDYNFPPKWHCIIEK
ncbi:nucleotide kinase domain-containing protein [Treponema sp. Marseille-Q4130]|uniref:nucleotide kinase domain-containing protein n=1 Tax=Treponema sp. Marseille-Q4130 TaxID=2766702 RepID=UPI001651B458|nr:nucleotide kinase domain-containing protein [Treponema sp. Marseille-Q4130]MBC6720514.1 hypothetical protein [Treponema sp. Marseille-Q4130]